jgi:hypothetical protein
MRAMTQPSEGKFHTQGQIRQDCIPCGVTKAIIHRFEMVNINHHHRQIAAYIAQQSVKLKHGVTPIEQSCQRVRGGHLHPCREARAQTVCLAFAAQLRF